MSTRALYNIIGVIAALAMLAACTSDFEDEGEYIDMPVRITIPVEGTATRAIGDPPGTEVTPNLPTHAYIYFVTYNSESDASSEQNMPPCTYRHLTLDAGWEYNDAQSADGSVIYTYKGDVSLRKDVEVKVGRVYVALSNDDITPSKTNDCTSEEEVRNVTFDVPGDYFNADGTAKLNESKNLNDFLKNLYSTPTSLNYKDLPAEYSAYNGKYYGTVLDVTTNVPHIDIVCYHVAAKLDVTWNVAEGAQATKRITSIQATGLYRQSCSLFKPAAVYSDTYTGNTYTQSFATIDAGNQWYGRASMYVIQHRGSDNQQTFTFNIGVEDSSKSPSATTVNGTTTVSYDDIGETFTPWMRGIITIPKSTASSSE